MRIYNSLSQFLRREQGATAVEYAVMIALILVVVMAGITATGGGVAGWWSDIDGDLDTHGF